MTNSEVVRDMLWRALGTLPYATIGIDENDPKVERMQAICRKSSVTEAEIGEVAEILRLEIETHETCDNFRKAEIISDYLRYATQTLRKRVKIDPTEVSDDARVLVKHRDGLVVFDVDAGTARAMGVIK